MPARWRSWTKCGPESTELAGDDERSAAGMTDDPIDWSCTRCGSRLEDAGETEFRVGGSSGAATFVFGGLAELGEGKMSLRMLICPRCGQLALFDPTRYPIR